MELLVVPLHYLLWHYTTGIRDLLGITKNMLWFTYHFFSIPTLLRTFFSPWKRISENYGKRAGMEVYMTAFVVNSIMRIIGMMLRSVLILFGIFLTVFIFGLGLVVLCVWLALPLLIVILFLAGMQGLLILI